MIMMVTATATITSSSMSLLMIQKQVETPAKAMAKNTAISPMDRRRVGLMVRANTTMMTMKKKTAVLD